MITWRFKNKLLINGTQAKRNSVTAIYYNDNYEEIYLLTT